MHTSIDRLCLAVDLAPLKLKVAKSLRPNIGVTRLLSVIAALKRAGGIAEPPAVVLEGTY